MEKLEAAKNVHISDAYNTQNYLYIEYPKYISVL